MAETDLKKQPRRGPGRRFEKGQSGNPRGKRPGTRSKVTMLGEQILQDEADAIIRAVVDNAKAGDPTAARLCIERIIPVRKGRPVSIDLPPVEKPEDLVRALGATVEAMGRGEISPDEASSIAAVLEVQRRVVETHDLAERVALLEAANPKR